MRIKMTGTSGISVTLIGYDHMLCVKTLGLLERKPRDLYGDYRMMADGRCFFRQIAYIPSGFLYDLVNDTNGEFKKTLKEWLINAFGKVEELRSRS